MLYIFSYLRVAKTIERLRPDPVPLGGSVTFESCCYHLRPLPTSTLTGQVAERSFTYFLITVACYILIYFGPGTVTTNTGGTRWLKAWIHYPEWYLYSFRMNRNAFITENLGLLWASHFLEMNSRMNSRMNKTANVSIHYDRNE